MPSFLNILFKRQKFLVNALSVWIKPFFFNRWGLLLTPLLPKNRSRYLNSVVFSKKIHGKS